MTRKSMILLLTVTVLLVAGALVVMAQDDGDSPVPFGPGWMHQWDDDTNFGPGMMRGHRGMMGRGGYSSGMMWNDREPMMFAVADALGLETEVFFDALRAGQTLEEIAKAQDVEMDTIYDVMLTEATSHMAEMVEAGYLTPEEFAERTAWMRENIAEMPMFSRGSFSPCWGNF